MKNFRTYQLAMELYKKGRLLKFGSTNFQDQFERASLSIVLNLAEGEGKVTTKDRRKFFVIAMGSLREVQACLEIIEHQELCDLANKLGAYLHKLIRNTQPKVL